MMNFSNKKNAVVIVVEGQDYRGEVFNLDAYQTKVNLCILAKANLGKHVWYYKYDEASNTWWRSKKFRWFGGRLHPSGKEESGLTRVPELEIAHVR